MSVSSPVAELLSELRNIEHSLDCADRVEEVAARARAAADARTWRLIADARDREHLEPVAQRIKETLLAPHAPRLSAPSDLDPSLAVACGRAAIVAPLLRQLTLPEIDALQVLGSLPEYSSWLLVREPLDHAKEKQALQIAASMGHRYVRLDGGAPSLAFRWLRAAPITTESVVVEHLLRIVVEIDLLALTSGTHPQMYLVPAPAAVLLEALLGAGDLGAYQLSDDPTALMEIMSGVWSPTGIGDSTVLAAARALV